MKAGFVCMGQVNCFVRKGTGTILSPLPPLNLGKCLAEGEVTVKIASFIKIDIWFVLRTRPFRSISLVVSDRLIDRHPNNLE